MCFERTVWFCFFFSRSTYNSSPVYGIYSYLLLFFSIKVVALAGIVMLLCNCWPIDLDPYFFLSLSLLPVDDVVQVVCVCVSWLCYRPPVSVGFRLLSGEAAKLIHRSSSPCVPRDDEPPLDYPNHLHNSDKYN